MFQRRDRRSWPRLIRETIYPRGGWRRALRYMRLRVERLPDDPRRIARGIAAGVFVSFSPLFWLHVLAAAIIAWGLRGNVIAAIVATFAANPLTMPLIAALALETGYHVLGAGYTIPLARVPGAFSQASEEIWRNISAVFGHEAMQWGLLQSFWRSVFLPYLTGGAIWGLGAAGLVYVLSLPLLRAVAVHRQRRAAGRPAAARLLPDRAAPDRTGPGRTGSDRAGAPPANR